MRTIIFVFLFSILMVVSTHAVTGQQWLSNCESSRVSNVSKCIAYLQGLVDMYNFRSDRRFKTVIEVEGRNIPISEACFPPKITLGQLEKIMRKYLNDNPEELHFGLSSLYHSKMVETFPCKTQ